MTASPRSSIQLSMTGNTSHQSASDSLLKSDCQLDHEETTLKATELLVDRDGKLSDEYILKRKGLSKPTVLDEIPVLADLTSEIDQIDGLVFSELVLAGYAKIASKVDELNKINVFPIADGDTGANMKICLKIATRNLMLEPASHISNAASNLAADVLLNGQGNSGTILSHFFVSLAEEIQKIGKPSLSVEEFASCLSKTGANMTEAVPKPVEGTIISVSRDCCQLCGPFCSLSDFLEAWNAQAQQELARTPDQLVVDGEKVLKKAGGVVDSGAQGFVYFVQGMVEASRGMLPVAHDHSLFAAVEGSHAMSESEPQMALHDHGVCDSKFQFCTEAVVRLQDGCTKADVVAAVSDLELGDSVACVQGPDKENHGQLVAKLHIHTNSPQRVFDAIRPFSRDIVLRKEKVEDMFAMRSEMHSCDHHDDDLANAKFTILGISDLVLPHSLRSPHVFSLPGFVVPSTTCEPLDSRHLSDAEIASMFQLERFEDTAIGYTAAAPSPMQIKMELLGALSNSSKPVLVFLISTDQRISAMGRNVVQAIDGLPAEQRDRITILNHGWSQYEASLLVEAMKCAKCGWTVDKTYAHVKSLADRNLVFGALYSAPTIRKIMKHRPGWFSKDHVVQDGDFFSFGIDPEIRSGSILSETERAAYLMNPLAEASCMDDLQQIEVERVKSSNYAIQSLLIYCVGRVDLGHMFVAKLREAGIEILDEPVVYQAGATYLPALEWGDIGFSYVLVDKGNTRNII